MPSKNRASNQSKKIQMHRHYLQQLKICLEELELEHQHKYNYNTELELPGSSMAKQYYIPGTRESLTLLLPQVICITGTP